MKSSKIKKNTFLIIMGLIFVGLSLSLLLLIPNMDKTYEILLYVLIGIGAGIFGGNSAELIQNRMTLKYPKLAKQMEIEENDERNKAISDKAKGKVFNLMIYAFAIVLLVLSFAEVEMYVIMIVVVLYLFLILSNICYLIRYQKEM